MIQFHPVKLELLRTGPPHNQLLSPLTPYIALCGNSWPVTFQIRHEHHRFLSRLERLRYVVAGSDREMLPVADSMREATVDEVGHDVADILAGIPSLLAELSSVRGTTTLTRPADHAHFAHLNLVLGGSELALIPFELAFAPQAFPGEGQEMALQLALPVVPTRQTRRSLPTFTTWDPKQEPKLLMISAAPAGLDVPLAEHLHALRAAIEPWVEWPDDAGASVEETARLPHVKKHLRVLANATLSQIEAFCASEHYTHIHILAHGGTYQRSGERQYGIVLCDPRDPSLPEVVSGKRLAKALQTQSNNGNWRSSPFLVTLATCDSGNPGSVLVPGGSIAHDLHDEGIPWVIASQFPLTKAGSVMMTETLYPGLLRGDDPRQVLHAVRRQLYLGTQRNHDWASIVAYASVPHEFERSIQTFFEKQSHRAIENGFARTDNLTGLTTSSDPVGQPDAANPAKKIEAQLNQALQQIRARLQLWLGRLPEGTNDDHTRSLRAECYGMHGAAFKRIALLDPACRQPSSGDAARSAAGEAAQQKSRNLLRESLDYYRKAMAESASGSRYHWAAVQMLSLSAVLGQPADPDMFSVAMHFARHNLQQTSTSEQAWAHGTLAELEMLSLHHKPDLATGPAPQPPIIESVCAHCQAIVQLMGAESFHAKSTRRQFQRYLDHWHGPWDAIAKAAVKELTPASAGR